MSFEARLPQDIDCTFTYFADIDISTRSVSETSPQISFQGSPKVNQRRSRGNSDRVEHISSSDDNTNSFSSNESQPDNGEDQGKVNVLFSIQCEKIKQFLQ